MPDGTGLALTRLAPLWLLLVALALPAAGSGLKSGVFDPPRMAPDFALRGSNGAELRLSGYRGKVVALGFGYTFCPDVCPTTLAELAQVRKSLGAAAKDFQVIYVTVDPERDSPEHLRKYLAAFDATFLGATGTTAQLEEVRKAYGIQISKKTYSGSQAAYVVHHSSYVYLVDREGKLRAMKPFGAPIGDMTHDVRAMLAATVSAQAGGGMRVEGAWIRHAPMMESKSGSGNGAVYATLVNAGKQPDALTGATTEAAGSVEIHETYRHMGMMMMRPVGSLQVAPDKKVELKPGGYHLMLLGLKQDLKAGKRIRVTLQFEKAGPVVVDAVVK